MKLLASTALFLSLAMPAFAGETAATVTPPDVLPEASHPTLTALPQSKAAEVQPLSVPDNASTAAAPSRGCHSRNTVYLTN